MNFPGGRYVCARGFISRNLPFLEGYSLGQVCHVVQIAMTTRKLLGYRSGAIVPYKESQTKVKELCAEEQRLCTASKRAIASWDSFRVCMMQVLMSTGGL